MPNPQAVETCPEGAVLAMDYSLSASAASAGSILLARLETRGAAGMVTDGDARNAPVIGHYPATRPAGLERVATWRGPRRT